MENVKITINGKDCEAPKGELLIEACETNGVYLPRFCHFKGLTPQASCRMCVVRVDNPKIPKLQTACTMPVTEGMVVTTDSKEIEDVRSSMIEFLLSNHPVDCPVCDRAGECELQDQTFGFGEDRTRSQYADKENYLERQISPFIYNDPQRCVMCKRCTRVCEEWMDEFAITTINRGSHTLISSFTGWVECSDCGNCVDVCPTGTLLHVPFKYVARPWDMKQTPTVCNFCSDGCSMLAGSRNDELLRIVARDGRGRTAEGINHDFLCSLGRYTIDFVQSNSRIDQPLIRRGDRLEPATWDEAIKYAAEKLDEVVNNHGKNSIGFIAAPRLLNEDLFALKKLATEAIGTPNIDFYRDEDEIDFETFFKYGAPPIATQKHIQSADVIILIGSDPNEENPLTAFSIRWAVRQKAARLIVINSMPSRLERQAHKTLRIRKASETAFIHSLLEEDIIEKSAEAMGVSVEDIREIRNIILTSDRIAVIFGDELRGAALESLALIDEALPLDSAEVAEAAKNAYLDSLQREVRSSNSTQKPSINENPYTYIVEHPSLEVGWEPAVFESRIMFMPLVRYSNSMGAWQMGGHPYLTYGLSAQQMLNASKHGIKALYLAGEDPLPKMGANAAAIKQELEKLDLLIVSELFLTSTAKLADIVLPVTSFAESQGTQTNNGSQAQIVRRAVPPLGQTRPEWMVAKSIAASLGCDFNWQGQVKNVFKEITENVQGYRTLSHNRLANEHALYVKRERPALRRLDRMQLMDRLDQEVAAIDLNIPVDKSNATAKAGSRLKERYPAITSYSEMLYPELPMELTVNKEGMPAMALVFPA